MLAGILVTLDPTPFFIGGCLGGYIGIMEKKWKLLHYNRDL